MYNWVKVCIEELKIDKALLDRKVQRLIDAMLWLYISPNLRLVLKSERLILICNGANLVHIPPPIAKEPPQNQLNQNQQHLHHSRPGFQRLRFLVLDILSKSLIPNHHSHLIPSYSIR